MTNFTLQKTRMPRFYRYIIYRLYTWRLENRDDTPIASTILLMAGVHGVQIMLILTILGKFSPIFTQLFRYNKTYVALFFILFTLSYYLIVYKKERWKAYSEEFRNESISERRRGTILLRLFTLGSIILFFVLIPILFWPKS